MIVLVFVDAERKAAMQLNLRLITYGAIVALVYLTIVSSLDDIARLFIVVILVATLVIIEKRAPRR